MLNSHSLTVPIALVAGLTLSVIPTNFAENVTFPVIYYAESAYQTTSFNSVAKEYTENNPRLNALQLFGVQSNFSLDEQKTYQSVLSKKSVNVGINILDLYKKQKR